MQELEIRIILGDREVDFFCATLRTSACISPVVFGREKCLAPIDLKLSLHVWVTCSWTVRQYQSKQPTAVQSLPLSALKLIGQPISAPALRINCLSPQAYYHITTILYHLGDIDRRKKFCFLRSLFDITTLVSFLLHSRYCMRNKGKLIRCLDGHTHEPWDMIALFSTVYFVC